MKTADLKADTYYAYKRSSYADPERVKVLVPAFDGPVKVNVGWGMENRRRKGVQVEFKDGRTEVVRPVTLGMTWADHQREAKAVKAARAEYEAEQAAALKTAAETVVALDALLRSRGATVRPTAYCYREEQAAALRAAGMPPAGRDDQHLEMAEGYEDEYVGDPDHFSSVFHALDDALDGQFDLDVLALLVKEA